MPEGLALVREEFVRAGFTEQAFRESLGLEPGPAFLTNRQLPGLCGQYFREQTPFAVLVQLFLVGCPVSWPTLARCLSAGALSLLVDARLVRREGDHAQADVFLRPLGDLYVAADRPDADGRWDYVIAPDASSLALALLLPPRASNSTSRALDIGTGCGVLALLAASTHDEVLGVDINPRALSFARFNAALNGKEAVFRLC